VRIKMKKKTEHQKRFDIIGETNPPSEISLFRKKYLKKGFDLVDVTHLCVFKLGTSGWCNDFNEPDDTIYHLQVWYRDECIGSLSPGEQRNWSENYVVFITNEDDCTGADFIIFRKVKK